VGLYYKDTDLLTCTLCHTNCGTCFGSTNNECITCAVGGTVFYYQNACISSCPDGWYQDVVELTCTLCSVECSLCDDGTAENCTSCNLGYYLDVTSCLSTCPDGKYTDLNTSLCTDCSANQLTCYGPDLTNLIACAANTYLDDLTRTCTDACTDGYFPSAEQCLPCYLSCGKCTD
jgi:proprotein convertase subtilisin/kexin type 5